MTDITPKLEFKSATLYALRAVVRDADLASVVAELDQRMRDAGSLFAGEPVVIDATELTEPVDWDVLMEAFSRHNLPVIGVVAHDHVATSAQDAGLARVELSSSTPRATSAPQPAAAVAEPVQATTPVPKANAARPETVSPEPAPAATSPTQVVQGPLRSGQRVYARGSDLIVMGVVSQGAEVIADGNIHIYGPLRGKAMAGARGDAQARIYTTALDAELVAIAGVYRVIDGPLDEAVRRKPAMIYLQEQTLRMAPLRD